MTQNLESMLRTMLVSEAENIAALDDPWPRFDGRERSHRRSRSLRNFVVAAFVAAAVGVQTNIIPLPGWAPSVAMASAWTDLLQGPGRGSLAADQTWLAGFRRTIKDVRDPEGLWKVGNRKAIKVVYADDVPGHRLGLVLVPLRLGLITSWDLIWYEGPSGAAPSQMRESGNDVADIPVATWMDGDADHGGVAVVVAPAGSSVTVSSGVSYSSSGVVEHRQVSTPDGSGIGVAALPPSGIEPPVTTEVTRGDKVIYDGAVLGTWTDSVAGDAAQQAGDAQLNTAEQGARGQGLDRAVLTSFVQSALSDSRLSALNVTIRLRWSGIINEQPAALITLQPHGGGVLAYAMHGTANGWRTDLRLLLPAHHADRRPIAWRMRAEGNDNPTDQVIVLVPAGATTATITAAGKKPVPVTIDASGFGTTTLPPHQAASVAAYTANRTRLASTPVPPFEIDSSGLPGDSPSTRITE